MRPVWNNLVSRGSGLMYEARPTARPRAYLLPGRGVDLPESNTGVVVLATTPVPLPPLEEIGRNGETHQPRKRRISIMTRRIPRTTPPPTSHNASRKLRPRSAGVGVGTGA